MNINPDDPLTVALVEAIRGGDINTLKRLLKETPGVSAARIGAFSHPGCSRTLLHVASDWPGHFPNGAATVAALIEAGAHVNARCNGADGETPLHWAASSDDIEVLNALIDGGADIEAPGAVIFGGSPLCDAVGFGQWRAARRLVQRGAKTALWHAAALGLVERVEQQFSGETPPSTDEVNRAFWYACHGGQRGTAEYLIAQGANLNWIATWEERTPIDTAQREGAEELVEWLRSQGARSAEELKS
jgi:hypothetical protein